MKAVYEATHDVKELGIKRGDILTVRPSHPTDPLLVTRRYERGRVRLILDHLDRFDVLACPPGRNDVTNDLRREVLGVRLVRP